MIRIDNDYVINVDANNYMPCVDLHKTTTDKKGNVTNRYFNIAYCSTLENALEAILNYKMQKYLAEYDVTLEQAINAIHSIKDEFRKTIEGVIND